MTFNESASAQTVSISFESTATGLLAFSPLNAVLPAVKAATLEDAVEETLAVKRKQGCRETYITSLRLYLKLFIKGREKAPIASIGVQDLVKWFDGRGERNVSRASNMGRLGAMFSIALRRGWIAQNPVKRLDPIRVERRTPTVLTPEQCEDLLLTTWERKPRYLAFLVLAMFAGVRPQEIPRLGGWPAIDLNAGTVRVDAAASKVRQRRIVQLMPAAVEWLKLAKASDAALTTLAHQGLRRYRQAMAKRLKLWEWPQDVLRHTCATYWLAEWQDAGKVALQLGHSPRILLTHYNGLRPPVSL
jgi:integrase/recombinase XerD